MPALKSRRRRVVQRRARRREDLRRRRRRATGAGGGAGPADGFDASLPERSVDRTRKKYARARASARVSRTLCAVTNAASETLSVAAAGNELDRSSSRRSMSPLSSVVQ